MAGPYSDSEEEAGGLRIDSDEDGEARPAPKPDDGNSSSLTPAKKQERTSSESTDKRSSDSANDSREGPSSSSRQPEPVVKNYVTADPSTFTKKKSKNLSSPSILEKITAAEKSTLEKHTKSPKSPKHSHSSASSSSSKPKMVDAATNVAEDDTDDYSFRVGSTALIKIVVDNRIPSVENGYTYGFTTVIKGRTHYGVFGDGFAPIIHNSQIQKRLDDSRAAAAEKDKDEDGGDDEMTDKVDESPKPRGLKRSRDYDGHHRSPSKHHKSSHRNKSPKMAKLSEVDDRKNPWIKCDHPQCGHRYLRREEVNKHKLSHVTTVLKIFDERASQTVPMAPPECGKCKQREQKEREENSLKALFDHAKLSSQSSLKHGEGSNVKKEPMEDEPAPKLEKEAPTSEMPQSESPESAAIRESRLPTISYNSRPTASAALSGQSATTLAQAPFINPQMFGGPFSASFSNTALLPPGGTQPKLLGFGSASSHVSPNPQVARPEQTSASESSTPIPNRHKIHELKTEPAPSSAGPSSAHLPTTAMPAAGARSITAGTSGGPPPAMDHHLIGIRPPPTLPAAAAALPRPQIASPMQLPLALQQQQLNINALMNAQMQQYNQQALIRMQHGMQPMDLAALFAVQHQQQNALQQQAAQPPQHMPAPDPTKRTP
uniref:C2H2-type domain-containing protein n=1 Tax=Panagrellus redivivus TaxID=6233 RepID=A0A7E5A0Y3_PANRE